MAALGGPVLEIPNILGVEDILGALAGFNPPAGGPIGGVFVMGGAPEGGAPEETGVDGFGVEAFGGGGVAAAAGLESFYHNINISMCLVDEWIPTYKLIDPTLLFFIVIKGTLLTQISLDSLLFIRAFLFFTFTAKE